MSGSFGRSFRMAPSRSPNGVNVKTLTRLLSLLRRAPRPRLIFGGERIGMLCSGDSASISYLLGPYLASLGRPVDRLGAGQQKFVGEPGCYHTVVVVRYLPAHWLEPLRSFRAAGGRIVYFMDDDLMDPEAAAGLPAAYAKRVRTLATRQRSNLEALCAEFLVGTSYLAQKYQAWRPTVLSPAASAADLAQQSPVTVCYHGTASHGLELAWLPEVVAGVQSERTDTLFEVFGDHSVNRAFRQLPCVAVLHPMSWPSYLAYTGCVRRDIGLAPLLPGLFNAARGPTKFLDFARMGAVGIYSDVAPYRGFIRPDVDGLLLPNEPEVWINAIAALAGDAPRRNRMAQAARQRALAMACEAGDIEHQSPAELQTVNTD